MKEASVKIISHSIPHHNFITEFQDTFVVAPKN
jgi:hypothetical protein